MNSTTSLPARSGNYQKQTTADDAVKFFNQMAGIIRQNLRLSPNDVTVMGSLATDNGDSITFSSDFGTFTIQFTEERRRV